MPAKVTADYSKFPVPIRDVMPYVEGEVTELRNHWGIHHTLFMGDKQKVKFYGECFGPLFGVLQTLLAKEMVLSICRLTDKDRIHPRDPKKSQRNLSIWTLKEAVAFAKTKDFAKKVDSASKAIEGIVANPRLRRHKEIAHFDLDVSLGKSPLPQVFFRDIKSALEHMEKFLNLFQAEFAETTVFYDSLSSDEIIETALRTAVKSKIYDELESENIIPSDEWERRMAKYAWWK